MFNFESDYVRTKNAAVEGAKIVNDTPVGSEVQAFSVGQTVDYTNYSPVRFYNGLIKEVYRENGYYYYIVSFVQDCKVIQRTFRQKDIELNYFCENKSTTRTKTAATGKVYVYTSNYDNDVITVNGRAYKVVNDSVWAIKVQKTQIRSGRGAFGLVLFLSSNVSDAWEERILNGCRPIKAQ